MKTLTIFTFERDQARHASLLGQPASQCAESIVGDLSALLWPLSRERVLKHPNKAYTLAVGALIAETLRRERDYTGRYSYVIHRPEAFTGQRIGYHPFEAVYDAMLMAGYIERGPRGHQQRSEFDGDGIGGVDWSKAGRFRIAPSLLKLLESYGIIPARWHDHFVLVPPTKIIPSPLIRRSSSIRVGKKKYPGKNLAIDYQSDVEAARLRDEIVLVNTLMLNHTISPDEHRGFQRIFAEGETPSFVWNKAGRWYSLGGAYQSYSKEERLDIMLDGEPVVEIDIGACHWTLLAAHNGVALGLHGTDPYIVPGLPRAVVKAWVTMTLGYHKFHARWPTSVGDAYMAEHGRRLQDYYPLRSTRDAILAALPVLADWPSGTWTWADLQYEESCIITDTMICLLKEHGIPCLPVHDSIIIPASKAVLGRKVLTQMFEARAHVAPRLVTNFAKAGLTAQVG